LSVPVDQNLLDVLLRLVTEGGAIAMRHHGNLDGVEIKADSSPLTKADLEVDGYLCSGLAELAPDIPVVTEERAASHAEGFAGSRFFLIDPIDGTKEFVAERGEFTINIGLVEDGVPVAGAVCAPAVNRAFAGAAGLGAWQYDASGNALMPISVSSPDNDALVAVASRSHLTEATNAFLDCNAIARTTNAGSSLKFCLLAAGEADIYPRFGPTMEWDTAAGDAVLRAAGGLVETLDGAPLSYAKPGYRNPEFIAYARGAKFNLAAA